MKVNEIKGYGETNSSIDKQFNSMSNNVENFNKLKEQFESQSVSERLKEFQKNRDLDVNPTLSQENINNINQKNIIENFVNLNPKNDIKPSISSNLITNSPKPKILSEINVIKKNKYSLKTYNLIINSIDRQWYGIVSKDNTVYKSNYTDRYKYTVNFSPMSDSTIKIPVYENNQYVPLSLNNEEDKIKILKGIRENNSIGFTFNGRSRPKYDPNRSKGEIIGYETRIIKSSSDGISTDNTFRNVVSVKLKRLIMPSYDRFCSYKDGNNIVNVPTGFKTEPYLLLHIDEINSNIITTNNINKSIFCKAHFDKEFCYKTSCPNRGYTYYCNTDQDIKVFYPSPLSELNKLSIEILKANGTLYSDEKDDLEIVKINVDKFIKITLNRFVNNNYFKLGDKILLNGLKKKSSSNALDSKILSYLNTELFVCHTENSTPNTNVVYVKKQLTDIDTNGDNIYFDNLTIPTDDYNYNGFLLNASHQHSIILEIKTQITDSLSVINPDII